MTGKSISHGAITVINAMPVGIGATIGVELETRAEFTPGGDKRIVTIVNDPGEDTKMAEYCVEEAYKVMKKEEPAGWTLTIDSQIPVSRGLKSSSSACNAILHAVFDEYKHKIDTVELVKHGVKCAKKAKVTVTGSFDDACGCELGGLVITNNTENKLLVHKDIETYDVVIYVPERKIRKNTLDVENLRALDNQICAAIGIADGYPLNAMTMNGRIISEASGVDNSVAEKALQDGALGAGMSGSGPAIAMVFNEGRGQAYIDRSGLKNTILTKTRGIQS
jgi:shikimate kinase